jgi:hypothetical protein
VATDCGFHTHTLVPDPDDASRVLLYVASYPASALGPTPFGTQCSRSDSGHSKISVVEVPLAAPERSRVIAQPTFELNDFGAPGLPRLPRHHRLPAAEDRGRRLPERGADVGPLRP